MADHSENRDGAPWWVLEVDGTHMGVAVTWWAAVLDRDEPTVELIRATVPAAQMFRSALEVLLGLVDWVSCNDGEHPDGGSRLLRLLSVDSAWLPPSQRLLARELGDRLAEDPAATGFSLTPAPVSTVMGLCLAVSRVIETRFGVPAEHQLSVYRDEVLRMAAGPLHSAPPPPETV